MYVCFALLNKHYWTQLSLESYVYLTVNTSLYLEIISNRLTQVGVIIGDQTLTLYVLADSGHVSSRTCKIRKINSAMMANQQGV